MVSSGSTSSTDSYFVRGLVGSVLGHLTILALIVFRFGGDWGQFQAPVIYSITLEGGKTIGGMSQVPKNEKAQAAPPKKVAEPAKSEPKTQPKEEPKQKEEPKTTKPVEDAEVSIKEKEKVEKKPEPKKPEPKKEEKPKPEEKSKPKDTKESKEKAAAKEPSLADINKQLQRAMQRYTGESSEAGGQGFGAASLGGNGMGGGVMRPPEFFTYKKVLEQHIKSGWHWFDTQQELITQVIVDIEPDGTVTSVTLSKSSGNPTFDDSVMRAVKKASPVPRPPTTVYQFFKSVRLTFDPRDL